MENEPSEFEARRPPLEPYVIRLHEQHCLAPDASLAEIEPVAKELWASMPSRFAVIELVLGRKIKSEAILGDPDLGSLLMLDDADQAFSTLTHFAVLEAIESSNQDP